MNDKLTEIEELILEELKLLAQNPTSEAADKVLSTLTHLQYLVQSIATRRKGTQSPQHIPLIGH